MTTPQADFIRRGYGSLERSLREIEEHAKQLEPSLDALRQLLVAETNRCADKDRLLQLQQAEVKRHIELQKKAEIERDCAEKKCSEHQRTIIELHEQILQLQKTLEEGKYSAVAGGPCSSEVPSDCHDPAGSLLSSQYGAPGSTTLGGGKNGYYDDAALITNSSVSELGEMQCDVDGQQVGGGQENQPVHATFQSYGHPSAHQRADSPSALPFSAINSSAKNYVSQVSSTPYAANNTTAPGSNMNNKPVSIVSNSNPQQDSVNYQTPVPQTPSHQTEPSSTNSSLLSPTLATNTSTSQTTTTVSGVSAEDFSSTKNTNGPVLRPQKRMNREEELLRAEAEKMAERAKRNRLTSPPSTSTRDRIRKSSSGTITEVMQPSPHLIFDPKTAEATVAFRNPTTTQQSPSLAMLGRSPSSDTAVFTPLITSPTVSTKSQPSISKTSSSTSNGSSKKQSRPKNELKNSKSDLASSSSTSLSSVSSSNGNSTARRFFSPREEMEEVLSSLNAEFSDKSWRPDMLGREDKLCELVNKIRTAIAQKKKHFFYISGPPGSGKTGSLSRLESLLNGDASSTDQLPVRVIKVNCTGKSEVFSELCATEKISIAGKGSCGEILLSHLDDPRREKKYSATVYILDEMLTKSGESEVLTKMFQWASRIKRHSLIVIGISNVLTQVTAPQYSTVMDAQIDHMWFGSYKKEELEQILRERLQSVSRKFPAISLEKFVANDAIELVALMAYNRYRGDARCAFDLFRMNLESFRAGVRDGTLSAPMTQDHIHLEQNEKCLDQLQAEHFVLLSCFCRDNGKTPKVRDTMSKSDLKSEFLSSMRNMISMPFDAALFDDYLRYMCCNDFLQPISSASSSSSRSNHHNKEVLFRMGNVNADDLIEAAMAQPHNSLLKKYMQRKFPTYPFAQLMTSN